MFANMHNGIVTVSRDFLNRYGFAVKKGLPPSYLGHFISENALAIKTTLTHCPGWILAQSWSREAAARCAERGAAAAALR